MKIVIDVPKKYKDLLDKGEADGSIRKSILLAVLNGTALPKGHGRLIDAGSFVDVLNNAQIEGLNTYKGLGRAKELLIEAPTIIEPDVESEG